MRSVAALMLVLVAAACSGVTDLSRQQRPLAGNEAELTRRKVDEAVKAKQFKTAWNLEAAASGTDPRRFEEIALATLADDDGDAREMFAQIRTKFRGYSDDLRAKIRALTDQAKAAKEWKRATDIQLSSADDAPHYKGAWDVYAETPAKEALGILERINDARQEYDEEQAKLKAKLKAK